MGDAAYDGSSEIWRQFIDANRTLIAKVPGTANTGEPQVTGADRRQVEGQG